MKNKYIPINKGNYSMESSEREELFEKYRGEGWEAEYKCYRESWIAYPREQRIAEYPLLVDIELSSVCNLKCPMCYTRTERFKKRVNAGFMDFALFRRIIDEIGGKVPAIRLSLRGEPTIHKHFVECITYAKSKGVGEVSFLTNGSTLTLQYFERIVHAGADWITISFDGLDGVYENIRKPLKYREVLRRIKDIKRFKEDRNLTKPVIKLQSVWPAIRQNPEEYYRTLSPHVDLIAYNPLIDYLSKDSEIIYEEDFSCSQHYQRLTIGADGLVMMCSNDEENTVVVGDATRETVYDIWHGERLNRMRDIHKQKNGFMNIPVCRRCYIPRKTHDLETAMVQGRTFNINNYRNRNQEIGK